MKARTAFSLGLLLGVAGGYAWWTREQARHRQALYARQPMRRLAALGWLSGQPGSPDAVLLLREYLDWEQNPVLRRRARRLLARFEHALA
ncbi:MAG TPA: hypothetical protein PK788_09855 [Gemmatimonadaceae bacterium]|nr:hypothetical protein [Gemmatimonadaceae bacterium]